MGYTNCCACAYLHTPNTRAHPATKNFTGSIRTATSIEPMFRPALDE